jgi:acyl-CoA reductase-like NAD-dependent aldehyde dehydrogenase
MSLGGCGALGGLERLLAELPAASEGEEGGLRPPRIPWRPTFFTDVDNAMMIACKQIFGPVLHSSHGL